MANSSRKFEETKFEEKKIWLFCFFICFFQRGPKTIYWVSKFNIESCYWKIFPISMYLENIIFNLVEIKHQSFSWIVRHNSRFNSVQIFRKMHLCLLNLLFFDNGTFNWWSLNHNLKPFWNIYFSQFWCCCSCLIYFDRLSIINSWRY